MPLTTFGADAANLLSPCAPSPAPQALQPRHYTSVFPTKKIYSTCSAAALALIFFRSSNPRVLPRRFAAAFLTSFWHILTTTASSPKIGPRPLLEKKKCPHSNF